MPRYRNNTGPIRSIDVKEHDRIYFLIDQFTEVAGTVVLFDDKSGKVVVRDDEEGDLLSGFEEHTRPNDDVPSELCLAAPGVNKDASQ